MSNEEFFAQRLSSLRNQQDISARDMSLSLGQNPGYINTIECGKAFPSMANFFYICDYLKISPKSFFDDSIAYPAKTSLIIEQLPQLSEQQLWILSMLIQEFLG